MIKSKTRDYFWATLVLSVSSFLVFANLYVVQPLLSMFAEGYDISLNLANWVFASASLGMSLCLIPWALLADRYGRRLVMLLSLGLSALFSLSLVFSDSVTMWIVLRLLQGIALAGLPAVAIAYISEEFEAEAVIPAVGIYIAANSIGGISGRILGGTLAEMFGLTAPMLLTALLTLLGALLTYFCLPKERYFKAQSLAFQTILCNLCGHIKNPLLWRTFLIGGICFGMFVNMFSVIGLRLQQAPWLFSTLQVSLLFLCYLSGTFAASMAGRFSRRFNAPRGMLFGWLLLMCGMLLLISNSVLILIAGLLLCSIGFFFTHALASAWVGKNAAHARALASALYLSSYYLGASIGGNYLLTVWQRLGWQWVAPSAMLLLLLVLLLLLGMFKPRS
ncbi:bicyclomycin/multidrug efflux system protein [Chelonobacter oris]|uniref:Bicyclomycin/multidrug efflux system protein n=1 Tax=Chelonobacter oris TaxID=505317 RepID=A0A0A3ATK3_9PAST|nr:MFS transporter [Chelonobacter oris]KGQ70420.1 bicyclomycin/multidrug efflux system protein [Chelonobacter oris]MDH3000440.1 bicyclomycin/multidrug efflux system protein [Chelonobacter oris]